ncbi:membrane protein insertion efficiency factor YidD [Litorivivens sp.]|uniref:membrane protein insertion efficiency factor YidD n=1 Tax=Litorivivens sp. TaxID=2020868 RepID=UPI003565D55E
MRIILVTVIRIYRYAISPLMASHCRFYPSCSQYALEAVETHGAAHGSWLATKRLCRCHPFTAGGFDPVPGSDTESKTSTQAQPS